MIHGPLRMTAPTELLVTVDGLRTEYQAAPQSDDAAARRLILAAQDFAEERLNRAVGEQARRVWLDRAEAEGQSSIDLEPFSAVTLKAALIAKDDGTYDKGPFTGALDTTRGLLDMTPRRTVPETGLLELPRGLSEIDLQRRYALRIDYTAGWTAATAPAAVAEFVLRIAGLIAVFGLPTEKMLNLPPEVACMADRWRRAHALSA